MLEIILGPVQSDLTLRARRTLEIMHRWGYAPTVEALAAEMLGGQVNTDALVSALRSSPTIHIEQGFVYQHGRRDLVNKSMRRSLSNRLLNGEARGIAQEFAADLVRICPFVGCVTVSGSVASGGYRSGDDIDFDLFVRTGTKYISYLIANLLGVEYAWHYRHRETDELHRIPFLPKVTCVNVVWPDDQARPFERQDENLAFELLRCVPLHGVRKFQTVLEGNLWLRNYFPQLFERVWSDGLSTNLNPLGRLLETLGRWPRVLGLLEFVSRRIAFILYRFVQWTRRGNPTAVSRMRFLCDVKRPYEVFQD